MHVFGLRGRHASTLIFLLFEASLSFPAVLSLADNFFVPLLRVGPRVPSCSPRTSRIGLRGGGAAARQRCQSYANSADDGLTK